MPTWQILPSARYTDTGFATATSSYTDAVASTVNSVKVTPTTSDAQQR